MSQLLRSGKAYFFAQPKSSRDLRFRRLCRNCVFWMRQIPATSGRLPGNDVKNAADSEFTSANDVHRRALDSFSFHRRVPACDAPIWLVGNFVLSCYLLPGRLPVPFAPSKFPDTVRNQHVGHGRWSFW